MTSVNSSGVRNLDTENSLKNENGVLISRTKACLNSSLHRTMIFIVVVLDTIGRG